MRKDNPIDFLWQGNIATINLYGGPSLFKGVKERPYEAEVIYCDKTNECSFYRAGKCLCCRSFLSKEYCTYGKKRIAYGYTSRAASCSKWVSQFKSHSAYGKLHAVDNNIRFGVVGEHYCFLTTFVGVKGNNRSFIYHPTANPLSDESWTVSHYFFVKKEDVTVEFLERLFSMIPCSLMGGAIPDYQEKIVPSMKTDIRIKAPDLWRMYLVAHPGDTPVSYVGKKA